jgi:hypothetical protein
MHLSVRSAAILFYLRVLFTGIRDVWLGIFSKELYRGISYRKHAGPTVYATYYLGLNASLFIESSTVRTKVMQCNYSLFTKEKLSPDRKPLYCSAFSQAFSYFLVRIPEKC